MEDAPRERPSTDAKRGRALIIATGKYSDPELPALRSPAVDAKGMRNVLADPRIGNFEVTECLDQPWPEWRRQIGGFFSKQPNGRSELLLLYISGHGVKDEAGRLYFAATDTRKDELFTTGVAATFIHEASNIGRRRPILIILDTCFSGAFTKGLQFKAPKTVNFADYFGDSAGTAVITASGAIQYARDGDPLETLARPSLFSKHVIEGLRTGKADTDTDGHVSLDDLFRYVSSAMGAETGCQRPERSYFGVSGDLVLATSPVPRAGKLPPHVLKLLEDPLAEMRFLGVAQLKHLVEHSSPPTALAARQALERLKHDDSLKVRRAAVFVLQKQTVTAAEVKTSSNVEPMSRQTALQVEQRRQVHVPQAERKPEAEPAGILRQTEAADFSIPVIVARSPAPEQGRSRKSPTTKLPSPLLQRRLDLWLFGVFAAAVVAFGLWRLVPQAQRPAPVNGYPKAQASASHPETAGSASSIPVQDCDRLAQPPNLGPGYPVSGVPSDGIDGNAAQEACRRALREFPGEPRFKAYLGLALEHMNNASEAASLYRSAAEHGNAVGQTSLGLLYEFGKGVPQSLTEAVKWYRLAADQGSASGQVKLGVMYENGRGVAINYMEAAKLYRQAADQGNAIGQGALASLYANGHGVPKDYTEALKWNRLATDQGNALAEYNLGVMYSNGQGVHKDYTEALKWYRLAADQGNDLAEYNLGVIYANAQGVQKNNTEALKWYRLAADQGNAPAQSNLGAMYANAQGVPQNYTEALKWYRLAADQGNAIAQVNLGALYAKGQGVPQNYAETLKWYRLAADQGNALGQYNLGTLYTFGQGVPQNYTEALKWYRLAADQGHAAAQSNIGVMYAKGQSAPQNYTEAAKWYRLAADQGNAIAQANLGALYAGGQGVPQNYAEALKWWQLAADQGSPLGQYPLGVSYATGQGVAKSYTEALKWYRLAADQGSAPAQSNLGLMYEAGLGVPKNPTEAAKLYRLAADQGNDIAQSNLGFMYENGNGVPKSTTEAAKWYRLSAKQGNQVAQKRLQSLEQTKP